jgi:hypothetical protein
MEPLQVACNAQSTLLVESGIQVSIPAEPEVTYHEALAYLDKIQVRTMYITGVPNTGKQSRPTRPFNLLEYEHSLHLGKAIEWKRNELSEIMKAVTAADRHFTVELTNTDSILIHCEPVTSNLDSVVSINAVERNPSLVLN